MTEDWKEGMEIEAENEAMKKPPVLPTMMVFRVFNRRGDAEEAMALMPEIPANNSGSECRAYMNHYIRILSAAHYPTVIVGTRAATAEESASLKEDLRQMGYVINEKKRVPKYIHEKRRADAKQAMQDMMENQTKE